MKELKEIPNRIKVEISQSDIRLGKQGDSFSCPIARAVKRAVGDHPRVDCDITVDIAGKSVIYELPKKAGNFINDFDADKKKVKPITFFARRYSVQ